MSLRGVASATLVALAGLLLATSAAAASTPNTRIRSGPTGLIAMTSVKFKFTSTIPGSRFQCKLDAAPWEVCGSPKGYSGLGQGDHVFRVRASKRSRVDKTPAVHNFTVDTIAPDTTGVSGPEDNFLPYVNGYTEDQTPSFTFDSPEAATFECRITSASSTPAFEACTSPYTAPSPLPRDAFYTFEVRAVDEAGNRDPTPGSWDFDVETPITEDQQTVEAAASTYFPDAGDTDALASCGTTGIDCPGASPIAPDPHQLTTASSRSIVSGGPNSHRYDVTVTHDSHTDSAVVLSTSGMDCDLTFNSANGATAHWTIASQLTFITEQNGHSVPGGRYISPQVSMNGVDSADYSLAPHGAGSSLCSFFSLPTSTFETDYLEMVGAYEPLCVALGPGYLAPCSEAH